MMMRLNATYLRFTRAFATLFATLLACALLSPVVARAADADKLRMPTVSRFTVDGTSVVSHAQGEEIQLDLIGTLPEDIESFYAYEHLPYWMVVSYDEGLTYVEDSASVHFVRASQDESIDITDQVRITSDANYRRLVAGTPNMTRPVRASNSRVVKPAAGDRIRLSYKLRLNRKARIGYEQGNLVYAHIEYARPASLDERINNALAVQARSQSGVHVQKVLAPSSSSIRATCAPSLDEPIVSDIQACEATTATTLQAAAVDASATADANASTAEESVIAPLDDGRVDGLTATPEQINFIYTHQLNITAVNGDTSEPLSGTSYRLMKEADGSWFVDDAPWTGDVQDATIIKTDAQGHASVIAIGAGTYVLEEVEPLAGYDSMSPKSVTIAPQESPTGLVLTASSNEGCVTAADAKSGMIDVVVRHYVHREEAAAGPSDNDDSNAGGRGLVNRLSRLSALILPQTGDIFTFYLPLAVLSVLALLGGLALRRKERGGTNTNGMPTHGGWIGKTEGKDHGC